jgi:hypothetical protein
VAPRGFVCTRNILLSLTLNSTKFAPGARWDTSSIGEWVSDLGRWRGILKGPAYFSPNRCLCWNNRCGWSSKSISSQEITFSAARHTEGIWGMPLGSDKHVSNYIFFPPQVFFHKKMAKVRITDKTNFWHFQPFPLSFLHVLTSCWDLWQNKSHS